MKKIIINYFALICLFITCGACSDFFNVETDNVLDENKYIDEETEMAAGFMGIMTKVQAIGDKGIYLTDTRAEMLEVTINAPSDLYALYNYEMDLTGNSYADPAPYYDVVIACNDYLQKMAAYRKNSSPNSIDMTHYEALIASTIRIKAWIYLNIAKIYGEAVWFEEALHDFKDVKNDPAFALLDIDQVILACRYLMDNGYYDGFETIGSKAEMKWEKYIDPDASGSTGPYFYWDYMVPPYFALYSEICLWLEEYQIALDLVLNAINQSFVGKGQNRNWMRNQQWVGKLGSFFGFREPDNRMEAVAVILYNYEYSQTNNLKKHFDRDAPNQYMLAPSQAGMDRYRDMSFNNLSNLSEDPREAYIFRGKDTATPYIVKHAGGNNSYQDDNLIYYYRSADLYLMLAEALNGVGRYEEVDVLMNVGMGVKFPTGNITYEGFTDYWTGITPEQSEQYPDRGIRNVYSNGNLGNREILYEDQVDEDGKVITYAKRANDIAILHELILEQPVEGRTLPAMVRMARRYNDMSIITDLVCPKYENPDPIREKIENGGYFIKWDLGVN